MTPKPLDMSELKAAGQDLGKWDPLGDSSVNEHDQIPNSGQAPPPPWPPGHMWDWGWATKTSPTAFVFQSPLLASVMGSFRAFPHFIPYIPSITLNYSLQIEPWEKPKWLFSIIHSKVSLLTEFSLYARHCIPLISFNPPFGFLLWFSHSVISDSLWLHELQHARLPCPSRSPRVWSDSCPLSQWCHPTTSSSVVLFSACPQSFPASGSFPVSQLFASGGQRIGASLFNQWIVRVDFL